MDLIHVIREHARGGGSGRGRGRPLGDVKEGIAPEVRDFVEPLRALFEATGMTFREFASCRPFSMPSLSRYLSGERVPSDQHFPDQLVEVWAQQNDAPEEWASRIRERLAELHRQALRATNESGYRKLVAGENLAAAVHERDDARRRARQLQAQLDRHRRREEVLQNQLRAIGAGAGQAVEPGGRALELAADRARLLGEIERLTLELAAAQRAQAQAQERCRQLEADLEHADNDVERERIAREAEEQRRLIAEAMDAAEQRVQDIDEVKGEAKKTLAAVRVEAARVARETQRRQEEADALREETRASAVRAVVDFESRLARRREEAERDLAARQAKAEQRLLEMEDRADQLRLEAEKLATEAEVRARMTVESAARQAQVLVAEAKAEADRIRDRIPEREAALPPLPGE